MRKIFTALFLAFSLLAGTAYAFSPMWLALGASVALHTVFGLVYSYMYKPVATPRGPMKMLVKLEPTTPKAAILDAQGQIETTRNFIPTGSFSYTVPCPSSYCKRSTPQTITGATPEALLDAFNTCPSDVCTPGGNVASQLGQASRKNYTGSHGAMAAGVPSLFLDFSSPIGSITFPASGQTCPAGYVYNSTAGKCDLSDVTAAREAGGYDGVCGMYRNDWDAFDPDCMYLKEKNYITVSTGADGGLVVAAADPQGDKSTAVFSSQPDGSTVISQTKPSADGGTRREDTTVSAGGTVYQTNTINYAGNPLPLYPGDPGGTPLPGVSGGSSSGACGTQGQANCSVTIAGDGHSASDLPSAPGYYLPAIGTFLSPLKDKFASFTDFKFPVHTTNCPVLRVDVDAWGLNVHTGSDFICEILESQRSLFSNLAVFGYLISAIFIVLGA